MRRFLTSALLICAVITGSVAQIETTQHFMNSLPQVVINNPAFVPKYKFALGLPGSSISMTYTNNGFTYNDLVREENGKVVADLSKWAKNLPEKSYITTTVQADIFRLGIRINSKMYLSLSSTAKGYGRVLIPKDMATLLVSGTSPYIGQTANISPEVQMTSFWENAVGLSLSPVKNLTIGGRIKVIKGAAGVQTKKSDFTISLADNYAMTVAADMNVKTSGLQGFDDFDVSNYMKNSGWGIDLGATLQPISKLTLAASLIDIGQINWKNNNYEYTLNKATSTYTFSGINIDEALEGNSDYFDVQMDSLSEKFEPTEKEIGSFRTPLPAKIYLSGSYEPLKNFTVGAILSAEKYQGRFAPGLTLALNRNFGRVISTSLSYTASNRSFNNLGAGLSLNLAPIQIYVVGDNLLRLPLSMAIHQEANNFINRTQVFTLRTGVNFVFGWVRDQPKKKKRNTNLENNKDADYIKVRKKR